MQKITNLFMFDGKAEEAMNFYVSLFSNSAVSNLVKYGPNEAGKEGTVKHASFTLAGQEYTCIDSSAQHAFTFTPSTTLVVNCDTEDEIGNLYRSLSENGQVFMPLAAYPFSKKFGWVADKYGVSWQMKLL